MPTGCWPLEAGGSGPRRASTACCPPWSPARPRSPLRGPLPVPHQPHCSLGSPTEWWTVALRGPPSPQVGKDSSFEDLEQFLASSEQRGHGPGGQPEPQPSGVKEEPLLVQLRSTVKDIHNAVGERATPRDRAGVGLLGLAAGPGGALWMQPRQPRPAEPCFPDRPLPSTAVSSGGWPWQSCEAGSRPHSLWQPAGPPGCLGLRVLPGQHCPTRAAWRDHGLTPHISHLASSAWAPQGRARGGPWLPSPEQGGRCQGFLSASDGGLAVWGLALAVGPRCPRARGGALSPARRLPLLGGSPTSLAGGRPISLGPSFPVFKCASQVSPGSCSFGCKPFSERAPAQHSCPGGPPPPLREAGQDPVTAQG